LTRLNVIPISRRQTGAQAENLAGGMRRMIVGQDDALDVILPYIDLHEAGLAPEGRPAGVFLLLGPTGTGKSRTVEALADALHGSERHLLRIDCGEFQLDHEVAKLIGAPPGYLGHRETHPMLSQQKLNSVTSERSDLSLVLFDEVEKAAPSFARLLLGVLDKATLKLGDNTTVNFERSLIFMTANVGAREMARTMEPGYGLAKAAQGGDGGAGPIQTEKLARIGMAALKKRFSPEFLNRIDRTITYRPLQREDFRRILQLQIEALERHIAQRLGPAAFRLSVTPGARDFLLDEGTSTEYGARQLKRAVHRHLIQPLAREVLGNRIPPGAVVCVCYSRGGGLRLRINAA
jgi:ATP-dependent Clp protease ATP-binding subunit ClpA